MGITVRELSQILYDAFEADGWGEIDPEWFKDPPHEEDREPEDGGGLYETLDRVVSKLNERK